MKLGSYLSYVYLTYQYYSNFTIFFCNSSLKKCSKNHIYLRHLLSFHLYSTPHNPHQRCPFTGISRPITQPNSRKHCALSFTMNNHNTPLHYKANNFVRPPWSGRYGLTMAVSVALLNFTLAAVFDVII